MANYANQTTRLIAQSLPSFPTQTSFTQLFGDTFAKQSADSLYLLEDLLGIGADLTNNNAVTFDSVTDLIISPVNVGTFDGVNQFLSTPTAVANQVGVGSFVASIWFKTTGVSNHVLIHYGDAGANQQNWGIKLSSNHFICQLDDGTTQITFNEDTDGRWTDDKWHIVSLIVDRTPENNVMSIMVDGELLRDTTGVTHKDISGLTLTLNNAEGLLLGARELTAVNSQFYVGQLSNVSLYIADAGDNTKLLDYNIPGLLEAGQRENAIVGNWTLSNNTSARINNNSQSTTDTLGDYTTSVINTSEGIYDIISLYPEALARGTMDVSIDGEVVFSQNQNAGSSTFNQSSFGTGIYISAGTHILKVGSDTTTGTTYRYGFQMLELIKRDGANEGDAEATSGILFGDEIVQRSNATATWTFTQQSAAIYNSRSGSGGSQAGQFIEGDLFLKKGLYNITFNYGTAPTNGLVSLFFGGVKVIDNLNTNSGGLVENNTITKSAFLEGGKTTVQFLVEATQAFWSSIRFELVSGKSNGDEVNIWGADDDGQVTAGAKSIQIAGSHRFNFIGFLSADQDSIVYPRYFSGGTYKVKVLNDVADNRGIMDIGFGGIENNIVDSYDEYAVSFLANQVFETTATIPRGLQEITISNDGKNGASSSFVTNWNRVQFSKIADIESTEDDNSDPVHGSTVLLAKHKSAIAEGDVTLNMGGVDFGTKYSKVIVIYDMSPSAQLNLQMQVSGLTGANYTTDFTRLLTGILTGENQTVAGNADIATNQIIPFGGGALDGEIEIVSNVDTTIRGFFKASFGNIGVEDGMWHYNAAVPRSLSEFRLFTSTSTWGVGATIEIYGVLK